jgi:hypothetical protein
MTGVENPKVGSQEHTLGEFITKPNSFVHGRPFLLLNSPSSRVQVDVPNGKSSTVVLIGLQAQRSSAAANLGQVGQITQLRLASLGRGAVEKMRIILFFAAISIF